VLKDNQWIKKEWQGLNEFYGCNVWSDGTNIYYSGVEEIEDEFDSEKVTKIVKQYILDGNTWEEKNWQGFTEFYGSHVWTDGKNMYYSFYENDWYEDIHIIEHYMLKDNKWVKKEWKGLSEFNGYNIWTDGNNIYYSEQDYDENDEIITKQFVLNGDIWEEKVWTDANGKSLNDVLNGYNIWVDGEDIYYSNFYHNDNEKLIYDHYILKDNKWFKKEWKGSNEFRGENIWSDGNHFYYSFAYEQYVIE